MHKPSLSAKLPSSGNSNSSNNTNTTASPAPHPAMNPSVTSITKSTTALHTALSLGTPKKPEKTLTHSFASASKLQTQPTKSTSSMPYGFAAGTAKVLSKQSTKQSTLHQPSQTTGSKTSATPSTTKASTQLSSSSIDPLQRMLTIPPRIDGLRISDFQMKRHIASGSHSCIYQVSDPRGLIGPHSADYAIKEVSKRQIKEAKLSRQIENEVKIMYSQSNNNNNNTSSPSPAHINIIQLITHFEDASFIYLVMEYVEGWSLRSMRLIQSLPRSQKFAWMQDLTSAVLHLHTAQLIHRDLNPDNVLIDSDTYALKLGGFSWSNHFPALNRKRMSKLAESPSSSSSGESHGFSPFTAPEIKAKTGHAASLDIWCLGMLFYFILSDGAYPFGIPINLIDLSTDAIKAIDIRIRQNAFQFDKIITAQNPKTIALITSMLSKDPEKRPTIQQIAAHDFTEESDTSNESQSTGINLNSNMINPTKSEELFTAALQRIKESDISLRKSIALAEKQQLTRIPIADLTRLTATSAGRLSINNRKSIPFNNNNNQQSSSFNYNTDSNDPIAAEVRRTIHEETQKYKIVEQINSMIQQEEAEAAAVASQDPDLYSLSKLHQQDLALNDPQLTGIGGDRKSTALLNSFAEQSSFYDSPEFINGLSKSIEMQLNVWVDSHRFTGNNSNPPTEEPDTTNNQPKQRSSIPKQILDLSSQETRNQFEFHQTHLGTIAESAKEDLEISNSNNNNNNDQFESPFSAEDQKLLLEYANQPLDNRFEESTTFDQTIEESAVVPLTGIIEESVVVPLTGIVEQSNVLPLTGAIEYSEAVPLTGYIEESTVAPLIGYIEESNVVPLTGQIEESSVVPLAGVIEESIVVPFGTAQPTVPIDLNASINNNQIGGGGIQKVFSSYLDIGLASGLGQRSTTNLTEGFKQLLGNDSSARLSTLQRDFLSKNIDILNSRQSTTNATPAASNATSNQGQTQGNGTASSDVFKANKSLLSKWKDTPIDTITELENQLAQLEKTRDKLLKDIKENEKDIKKKLKPMYLKCKDYRFNDPDTPLGLRTSMSDTDIEICSLFEYQKYDNSEKISDLEAKLAAKNRELEAQEDEERMIANDKVFLQAISDEIKRINAKIEVQQQGIEFIGSVIMKYSNQVAKYATYKDLEKLRDSLIGQRDSLSGVSDTKIEESNLKEVISAIGNLNRNPILYAMVGNTYLGRSEVNPQLSAKDPIPFKQRISLLNEKEYQLKQEILDKKSKINEEAHQEFERKKAEMIATFAEKRNAQDEFYVARIADLEDKIAALKLEDVPMHELEIQRNNKKQIEADIQALEQWLEKNSKPKPHRR